MQEVQEYVIEEAQQMETQTNTFKILMENRAKILKVLLALFLLILVYLVLKPIYGFFAEFSEEYEEP